MVLDGLRCLAVVDVVLVAAIARHDVLLLRSFSVLRDLGERVHHLALDHDDWVLKVGLHGLTLQL